MVAGPAIRPGGLPTSRFHTTLNVIAGSGVFAYTGSHREPAMHGIYHRHLLEGRLQ